mmetsp:Transcript_41323/g.74724  ORF Transcript_41323/g.74724 Transcript_41323/m.74724 type:complete len:411 (-) Transcript_41323:222-1454(-)
MAALPQWSFLEYLEPFNVEAGVQMLTYGCVMTLGVSVATCTGIGAAVVMVICVEILHTLFPIIDDSMMAIFTVLLVQEATIAPTNTIILWRSACWPLVAVAGVLWMAAEMCGYEIMVNTDVALLKRFLGLCLVLVLAMNHVLPMLKAYQSQKLKLRMAPKAQEPSFTRRSKKYFAPVNLGKGHSTAIPAEDSEIALESEESVPPAVDDGSWEVNSCFSEAGAQPQSVQQSSPDVECRDFKLSSPREWLLAIYLGLLGGLLRGTCGATILALVSFVLWSGISREQWRATSSALTTVGLPARLYYFLVVKGKFEPSRWPQMTGSFIGCLIGIPLGHALSRRVNHADFLDFINFIVVVGATLLLTDGLEVSTPLGVTIAGVWLVAYGILRLRRKGHGRNHEDSPETSCDADAA